MNRNRMADLANIIEQDQLQNVEFEMRSYATTTNPIQEAKCDDFCGTAACIAGYIVCAAYGNKFAKAKSHHEALNHIDAFNSFFFIEGARILDLTREEAQELFLRYLRTTKNEAVEVLRHAAETGEIDFDYVLGLDDDELEEETI